MSGRPNGYWYNVRKYFVQGARYNITLQNGWTHQINLQITQATGNFVEKDKVLAQINLSSEGVRIAGNKIQIDGNTIFNSDTKFNGDIIVTGKQIGRAHV